LYARGADAAFGADMYQWGYQAGLQAVQFLKTGIIPKPELVKNRTKIIRKNFTYKATTESNNYFLEAIIYALTFSGLCIGLFMSMSVFNLPDITTDGSFTLGSAVTASLTILNFPLWIIFIAVLIAGGIAGITTALIHTKLKVNALLSGIITMTALYSINLLVMQKSNIPLVNHHSIFTIIPNHFLLLIVIALLIILKIVWLLKTDLGIAMRATGANELMVKAQGVQSDRMKILGLGIANALIAFSGFLVTQYQGFADINMGIGIVIFGLGSVMIGNTIFDLLKFEDLFLKLVCIVVGAIIFRLILALALTLGVDPTMLKLITAVIVLVIVAIPSIRI
jgi:putative ABC transport system permease protein